MSRRDEGIGVDMVLARWSSICTSLELGVAVIPNSTRYLTQHLTTISLSKHESLQVEGYSGRGQAAQRKEIYVYDVADDV